MKTKSPIVYTGVLLTGSHHPNSMILETSLAAAITVVALAGFVALGAWIQKQADKSTGMRILMICLTLLPALGFIGAGVVYYFME